MRVMSPVPTRRSSPLLPSVYYPTSPLLGTPSYPPSYSKARRYRLLFLFLTTATLIFTTIYSFVDHTTLGFKIGSPPSINISLDPKLSLGRITRPSYLWSYVSSSDATEERQAWDWVVTQRRKDYRRPSWGGLEAQGPKAHMRDNLIGDKHYLTTLPVAGFNNEVMEICNLIAISIRSNRIPILAPLWPDYNHLQHKIPYASVSEVFDFTDLIARYNIPIIDMLELKVGTDDWGSADERHKSVVYDGEHPRTDVRVGDEIKAQDPEFDDIKCWNAFWTVQDDSGGHIGIFHPGIIEDTPMPISIYANITKPGHTDPSLPLIAEALVAYSKPTDTLPPDVIARMEELKLPPSTMSPDDPLGCVNRLYYAHMNPGEDDVHDDWRRGVGAWDEVGKYLKFQPGFERLAGDLLRGLMGVKEGKEVPPYMAVHIRRTDFSDVYKSASQMHWASQAWNLLHKANTENGMNVKHVIFTTDETDEAWLKPLRDIGWIHIDHIKARTGERLGWWFPTILDSIILSGAKVFLGVPSSTMSILPYRRVIEWNNGIGGFVQDPNAHPTPDDWKWSW